MTIVSAIRLLAATVATAVMAVSAAVPAAPALSPGSPFDRRVATVEVRPAWLAAGAAIPLHPGDMLTPANLSAATNAVKDAVSARGERYGEALGSTVVAVTYVEPEFTIHENGEVGVTLRPFYVALPIGTMGKLALPVPRELPRGELRRKGRLLPAEIGLTSDRTTGIAGVAAVRLGWGGEPAAAQPFSFSADGQQSLENAYHQGAAAFRYGISRSGGTFRGAYVAADAASALQPVGDDRSRKRSAGLRAGAAWSPWRSSRLQVDTSLHGIDERFTDRASGTTIKDTPEAVATRLLFERVPPRALGFVRASLWHDVQRSQGASTQRLIGRIGYAREWLLRPNQAIGFEVVAGAGELWGASPERRRFHGGSEIGSFLYDSAEASTLLRAPDGPIVRSFGRAQAALSAPMGGASGGTRFRHISLNVSLPVPRWSRPLIPAEPVGIPGPDGRDLTIKDVLRNQVDRSGPNMLASSLAKLEQLDAARAQQRASEVFAEIQPAVHYIVDRANIFAVKPLLLFDAATLESATGSESWAAAGAGLQLIVVTAKLDIGYMRTLSGRTPGSNDNVFARLGFERLF